MFCIEVELMAQKNKLINDKFGFDLTKLKQVFMDFNQSFCYENFYARGGESRSHKTCGCRYGIKNQVEAFLMVAKEHKNYNSSEVENYFHSPRSNTSDVLMENRMPLSSQEHLRCIKLATGTPQF